MSVAAALGDAAEALRAATLVDPDRLPEGLRGRRAQVHLDLAWAHARLKRGPAALLHLLEAARVAAETVRYNVAVRETVREMVADGRRRPTSTLRGLAVRAGVLD